jgi:RNA ligase (TIGR02306 family)
MTKDATIELIKSVESHPNADRLDLVKVMGFQCVTQKDLYKVGDKIIYIKSDALLPIEKWTEEYRKYSPKRIKAVKLRNEWSEGIIVPFYILPNGNDLSLLDEGYDVSELINVTHYEAPVPNDLKAKGNIPYSIPKTDENRWESERNLPFGEIVDILLKKDGQSCSYFNHIEDDKFGILGRTLELHEIFENKYTAHIKKYDLKTKLINFTKKYNVSLCIRGESCGLGIQSNENNPQAKENPSWSMFSVFNIKEYEYAYKGNQFYFLNIAEELDLPIVDIIEKDVILTQEIINKYSTGITKLNGLPFEGVIVQHSKGSFKIINKDYDSKK